MLLMLCGDIETLPGPNLLTRDEFQQHSVSSKGLKIFHQNIRGILSNFDMLQEFLVSHKNIDIATISETHLSGENHIDLCELDGYTFKSKSRAWKRWGCCKYILKTILHFNTDMIEKMF